MIAPLLSIVTPSYNQGRFIERTVRSVLQQQGIHLDYVVIDGGSQDETVAILRGFGPRIMWSSAPDRGQAAAVNKGIGHTSGEIIGWLNSDDVYYPGALSSVCSLMQEHASVDVVYGDANHINEDDEPIGRYPTHPWDAARLQDSCFLCQPAVFFRRSIVDRFGGLDENLRYCMDYEYWLRLARGGARFAYLNEVLAGSRLYPGNKTLGERVQVHKEINDMTRLTLGATPNQWLFNYGHALVDSLGIKRSWGAAFRIAVSAASMAAALRWNRGVSSEMAATTKKWLRGR